eukprot:COSAG02_NODE_49725_length_325_cov_0.676991_2_plen_48_part_01
MISRSDVAAAAMPLLDTSPGNHERDSPGTGAFQHGVSVVTPLLQTILD